MSQEILHKHHHIMHYTGIGSRQTPNHICDRFAKIASNLERRGYILRSGGADGADRAFEAGVYDDSMKEIWLPWKNFNGNRSRLLASKEAFIIAEQFHPAWHNCKDSHRFLHARNSHQILGKDLATPSLFVICYSSGGLKSGGTSQALRIATAYNIPIFNFFESEDFNEEYLSIR